MDNDKYLQQLFLEKIAQKHQVAPKNMAKELASVLNINSNVIYDRLSLKKLFNLEELATLVRHYKVSLDDLLLPNSAVFHSDAIAQQPSSFEDYLLRILKDLRTLKNIPQCEIAYSASEVPFFYYLFYNEVVLFKMYIYGRTVWNIPNCQNGKFSLKALNQPALNNLIQETKDLYVVFPTTECWTVNMLDTTINQIRHCLHCDLFQDPNDAITLLKGMEKMVDTMEKIAKTGTKNGTAQSFLYHNEMMQSPTLILVKSAIVNSVYFVYDSPNFMVSNENTTFSHASDYFEKIKHHSLPLNLEVQRIRFFKIFRTKLESAKEDFLKFLAIGAEKSH